MQAAEQIGQTLVIATFAGRNKSHKRPISIAVPIATDIWLSVVPMELGARTFKAHATIASKLGIELQSAGCRSDRLLPTQLPIDPINKRANFKAVEASFQMHS